MPQKARQVLEAARTIALGSDAASVIALTRVRAKRAPSESTVRLRPLAGKSVTIRPYPRTVDVHVVHDTFIGRHHRLPKGMRPTSIVDLGANIGLTMADYAEVYPDARIVGVELDPGNAVLATRNTASYPNCRVVQAAVWSENGSISYDPSGEEWSYTVGPGSASAESLTIDALLKRMDLDRVDVLKMDIEGAEQQVLQAGGDWPERVGMIKVEIHRGYALDEAQSDLRQLGFSVEIDSRHWSALIARR